MKKGLLIKLGLVLSLSAMCSFVSFADYVEDTGYSANREGFKRDLQDVDRLKTKIEETEEHIASLEEELAELEPEFEEVSAAYEAGEVDFVTYHKIKTKYGQTKNAYNSAVRALASEKSSLEALEESIEEYTEDAMAWDGYSQEGDEDITYTFSLVEIDGDWVLGAGYRAWTGALGGRWEYSTFINENLKIAFYDGNDCLDRQLERAKEHDTETAIFWDVTDDLTGGKKYYIEVSGQKYGVYAKDNYKNTGSSNSDSSFDDEADEWDGDSNDNDVNEWDEDSNDDGVNERDEDSNSASQDNAEKAEAPSYYWAQNDVGWWVQSTDGTYLINQWYRSPASGLWYYMGADGYMLTNTVTPDGYTFNAEGVWVK